MVEPLTYTTTASSRATSLCSLISPKQLHRVSWASVTLARRVLSRLKTFTFTGIRCSIPRGWWKWLVQTIHVPSPWMQISCDLSRVAYKFLLLVFFFCLSILDCWVPPRLVILRIKMRIFFRLKGFVIINIFIFHTSGARNPSAVRNAATMRSCWMVERI